MQCCPTCGRTMTPKPKAKKGVQMRTPAERAKLSDTELHAYYKRISGYEDVKFFLDLGQDHMPAKMEAAFITLKGDIWDNGGSYTPALKHRFVVLKGQYWQLRREQDRKAGIADVGVTPLPPKEEEAA